MTERSSRGVVRLGCTDSKPNLVTVAADHPAAVNVDCPKRMVFGPCGGVREGGTCEMRPAPCAFSAAVTWPQERARRPPGQTPLVLADFSAPAFDSTAAISIAGVLSEYCDAVLVGEHSNRPDLPPTLLARHLLDAGATPWITLACRDRNRVMLEQELRGLSTIGIHTVLCVTGDGSGYDVRTDVTQVFDLDGLRLAALAAEIGLTAAVPETPTAPPRPARPGRLVQKQRAGAGIAVLNHVSSPNQLTEFMAAAITAGLEIPVLAGIAVFTDRASAAVLDGLPGLHLDPDIVAEVLDSDDPVDAGVAVAVRAARAALSIPGIVGVNLSGSASSADPMTGAHVKAEIGRRLQASRGGPNE